MSALHAKSALRHHDLGGQRLYNSTAQATYPWDNNRTSGCEASCGRRARPHVEAVYRRSRARFCRASQRIRRNLGSWQVVGVRHFVHHPSFGGYEDCCYRPAQSSSFFSSSSAKRSSTFSDANASANADSESRWYVLLMSGTLADQVSRLIQEHLIESAGARHHKVPLIHRRHGPIQVRVSPGRETGHL